MVDESHLLQQECSQTWKEWRGGLGGPHGSGTLVQAPETLWTLISLACKAGRSEVHQGHIERDGEDDHQRSQLLKPFNKWSYSKQKPFFNFLFVPPTKFNSNWDLLDWYSFLSSFCTCTKMINFYRPFSFLRPLTIIFYQKSPQNKTKTCFILVSFSLPLREVLRLNMTIKMLTESTEVLYPPDTIWTVELNTFSVNSCPTIVSVSIYVTSLISCHHMIPLVYITYQICY